MNDFTWTGSESLRLANTITPVSLPLLDIGYYNSDDCQAIYQEQESPELLSSLPSSIHADVSFPEEISIA